MKTILKIHVSVSKAIAEAASDAKAFDVEEVPGQGLSGTVNGEKIFLGRWDWCGVEASQSDAMELWMRGSEGSPDRFTFSDQLRPDAVDTIAAL